MSTIINQTSELLTNAVENRRNGDYAAALEYADSAWEKWRKLTKRSDFVLANLGIITDVTVSLSRVGVLAEGEDDTARFIEECIATILLLEDFLSDNR